MARDDRKWPRMPGNDWGWLEKVGDGREWLGIAGDRPRLVAVRDYERKARSALRFFPISPSYSFPRVHTKYIKFMPTGSICGNVVGQDTRKNQFL